MERDELGREVRHVPAPGHHEPELDEDAWPELEHSPYTFEGRIEQLGVMARGVNRRRWPPWVRVAGWILAVALLLPFLVGAINLIVEG